MLKSPKATTSLSKRHSKPTLRSTSTRTTTKTPLYKKKSDKKVIKTLTPSTNVKSHTPISHSPHGVLVRDFIRESLYSKQGYFNSSRVINSPGVINFSQLLGKSAYEKRIDELYFSGVQGWSTPVEIFQPFYAQSLARFFVSHIIGAINFHSRLDLSQVKKKLHDRVDLSALKGIDFIHTLHGLTPEEDFSFRQFGIPLKQPDISAPTNGIIPHIVEIGAGNGTCASNIMDFLATFYPNIYSKTTYDILEMSESLSWQQRELLDASHSGKYTVHTMNAAEMVELENTSTNKQKTHTFLFGLEVLDNMVHDKVIKGSDGKWYQVMVAEKSILPHLEQQQESQQEYSFVLYDHPADIPASTISDSPASTNSDSTLHSLTSDKSEQLEPLQSGSIQKLHQQQPTSKIGKTHTISYQELHQYITKAPFPVDYQKLNTNPTSQYLEYVMPIYDPIIEECAALYDNFLHSPHSSQNNQKKKTNEKKGFLPWLTRRILKNNLSTVDDVVYLPTESLRFIHRINKLYPSHTLLLADFDVLPTTESVRAKNGPVIAHKSTDSQLRGKTKDETSYLVELGLCDIFFPTDFEFLQHMYNQVVLPQSNNETTSSSIRTHLSPLSTTFDTQQSLPDEQVRSIMTKPTKLKNTSLSLTQDQFLTKYAHTAATECKNGFNPMLSDYANMSVFIGQRNSSL